jgi:polysaccharide biosynthesis protein PslH
MRILVISARFPEHGESLTTYRIRGDQVRAFTHISHLAERHSITLVSAAPPSSDRAIRDLAGVGSVRISSASMWHRAASAAQALAAGQPAQVGWTMPQGAWRVVREEARKSTVAIAITARSVRGPLPCPFVIDHVDALSRNLMNRASGSEVLPIRGFAALEARLMRRWESRIARFAAAQIATSQDDAGELPEHPPVVIVPVAWRGTVFREPPGYERDYDVVVSGDMRYPPNREAVASLTKDILPLVRARRPSTRALVVGRAASSLGLEDVDIASDVPDLLAYLRRARIAVVPLMRGPMGSPYKAIEAAASGAVLVAPSWVLDCFGLPGRRASTVEQFADEIVSLLEDEPRRARLAADAIPIVELHSTPAIGRRLEAVLEAVVS